jgi:hypothetical protein
MMDFEWADGFVYGRLIDPVACGQRLMELWAQNNHLSAEDVVEDSKNESSPFRALIWKDSSENAERLWRENLARQTLRSITVVSLSSSGEKIKTRLFQHLTITIQSPRESNLRTQKTYVPITIIKRDVSLLSQLIEKLDNIIDNWKRTRHEILEYMKCNPSARSSLERSDNNVRHTLGDDTKDDAATGEV